MSIRELAFDRIGKIVSSDELDENQKISALTTMAIELAEWRVADENQINQLKGILKRTIPWLGKLIAEGVHLNCSMPNDAIRTLEMAEKAII